ncbi:ATP-binding protein [Streptomyces sp. NBC_00557]|uniref:ATP-binding protein n=1 Tax=Streptomyces sp. NBC_00557 TaxID=2975776 RepID=UPI002E822EBD|nr:ATP-binding protein [Streptomyces sp. NBC_00557]WUC37249.1 ATP-binding protein [Streptomyces sp. NBC_00557]
MSHSSEERYDPLNGDTPQTADRARDVARSFLSVLAPSGGDEADAVLLVVTELISNAVRHAGGVTGFGLRAGPGTVTVTVHDASRRPPRPQLTDPREPGGFGWLLVQELALDVQVSVGPTGKAVSAVLPLFC